MWQRLSLPLQTTCETNIPKMKLCMNLVHIHFVTFMKRIAQMKEVSKHRNEVIKNHIDSVVKSKREHLFVY
jgi:hypothetical protein